MSVGPAVGVDQGDVPADGCGTAGHEQADGVIKASAGGDGDGQGGDKNRVAAHHAGRSGNCPFGAIGHDFLHGDNLINYL
ncbi:hypothetical protein L3i22_060790 [Actinoplanes sp. L3-i22]|nr:hypothetical protein L3i22_060790 [Actinoplanes sp. L3-i22]